MSIKGGWWGAHSRRAVSVQVLELSGRGLKDLDYALEGASGLKSLGTFAEGKRRKLCVTLLYSYLASHSTPRDQAAKGESTLLGDPAMVICAQVICSGDLLARR